MAVFSSGLRRFQLFKVDLISRVGLKTETTDGECTSLSEVTYSNSDQELPMTKMDMVWVAVAELLHPTTAASRIVTRDEIVGQQCQDCFVCL